MNPHYVIHIIFKLQLQFYTCKQKKIKHLKLQLSK